MDFKEYFKRINAQKKIDKAAKKYKDKRIVLYGAGSYAAILFENYDLSKLNIVAVVDRKFENPQDRSFFNLNCISPEELKTFDCDIILITNFDTLYFWEYLEDDLLDGTKNEDIKIRPLIQETFFEFLKNNLFKR